MPADGVPAEAEGRAVGEVKVDPRSSRTLEDVKILSIRKLVEEKKAEKKSE